MSSSWPQQTINSPPTTPVPFLTQILNPGDEVVADIESVQLGQGLKVLQVLNEVLLQVQTAQLHLVVQVLKDLDAIVLQPQALETSVLFQVLYLIDPWNHHSACYTLW